MRAWLRRRERVLAVAASTVIMMAGQGITGPVLPLYARDFGVSTAVVGLTITTFALARFLVNLPAGSLADRRGRRPLLWGGPLITAVGMIGSGMAFGIVDLLGWRFVAGAGSAIYMTGAQLYILDVSAPERRARNISFNTGALLFGLAIGPAIGGVVAEVAGLRAPFLLVGALSVGAAVYGWFRLAEPPRTGPDARAHLGGKGSWKFLRRRDFLLVAAMSFVMFATRSGTRATLVPLLAVDRFGLSEAELGAVLGATALTGFLFIAPAGIAADRLGRKATIVPSGAFAAVGVLMIASAPSSGWLFAALWVMAVGTSVTGPSQYAFVADTTSEAERGRALGLYRSAGDLGFLVAPPVFGLIADGVSVGASLVLNAVLLGAATVAFWTLASGRRRSVAVEAG